MPFISRLVNKFKSLQSDIPSRLSFRGEIASLISGNPKNTNLDGEANVYIDDFEGAQTNIDIKGFSSWKLASVPFKNFKGSGAQNNDLSGGYGRAKLAWYSIDPIFYTSGRPQGITNNDISFMIISVMSVCINLGDEMLTRSDVSHDDASNFATKLFLKGL